MGGEIFTEINENIKIILLINRETEKYGEQKNKQFTLDRVMCLAITIEPPPPPSLNSPHYLFIIHAILGESLSERAFNTGEEGQDILVGNSEINYNPPSPPFQCSKKSPPPTFISVKKFHNPSSSYSIYPHSIVVHDNSIYITLQRVHFYDIY